jgi:OOP family OmpA-OmpF porin
MKQLILALVASIAAAGVAQAQSTDGMSTTNSTSVAPYAPGFTPHAYIGIGAASADNLVTGDYRVSPKIFGGYEFTPNWAVEAGYTHFGEETAYIWAGGDISDRSRYRVKGYSSYVAGKYTIPLSERFSAFGKLGLQHSERINDVAGFPRWTERDTGLYGGLGVQYALSRNLALTGEYERYGKDKNSGAKADVYTVGLKYGF